MECQKHLTSNYRLKTRDLMIMARESIRRSETAFNVTMCLHHLGNTQGKAKIIFTISGLTYNALNNQYVGSKKQ